MYMNKQPNNTLRSLLLLDLYVQEVGRFLLHLTCFLCPSVARKGNPAVLHIVLLRSPGDP